MVGTMVRTPKFKVGSNVKVNWSGHEKDMLARVRARMEDGGKWVYLIYTLDNKEHTILSERYLKSGV